MATNRLLPALAGGKEALPPDALKAVMALNGPRPARFILEALKAWAVVAAAIGFAVWSGSWVASAFAVIVVATRQNVLGLLVHEQAHLGLGGRFGDWIANLLAGYPLLVLTVEGYAQVHLTHHREYFSDKDPDAIRKSGEEWRFPKGAGELASLFFKDLIGLNTVRMIRGKNAQKGAGIAPMQRKGQAPKWLRLVFLASVAAVLTVSGTWAYFFLYWFLPLITVTPAIVRWGAVCEHEYNWPGASMLATTPLIIQPWHERLLLPMLNFGMHPYHHLFPGVSFSQLPAVHRIFQDAGLVNEQCVFHGSLSYLRFLCGAPHARDLQVA